MQSPWRPAGGTLGVVTLCIFVSFGISATELSFRGPFSVSGVRRPVTVHAGDVDGNGKLDLIASNGTGVVTVFFQDIDNREIWEAVPVRVGASCFFTRAGDFDNDGFDDLAVADGGSVTHVVRSRGDRTFDTPSPLRESRGSRWIALGDWDRDGNLDLASSNLATSTLTIFVGDGAGNFTQKGRVSSGREHTLEALDYDGDGVLDLALGTGIPGIQLHQGQGDGTFKRRHAIPGHLGLLGCVEYISVGDFNNDGLDDLAPTCIDDQTAYAGVSLGNGRYERILKDPFAAGTESTAVGDFNSDGNEDLFLVSNTSPLLRVYPGKGDGTFEPFQEYGNTGNKPVFLISEDIDRDGRDDVISADELTSSLTVFFGRDNDDVFESSLNATGYGTGRDFALGDLDKDGLPDFFFADTFEPNIHVYLKPGLSSTSRPTLSVTIPQTFELLEVVDLNSDGTPDLLGGDFSTKAIHAVLLDVQGSPNGQVALPCGGKPRMLRPALMDEGSTVDVVTLCAGPDEILVFLGNGDGTFERAPTVPTIESSKRFSVGDIDGDGRNDVVVSSANEIAIHTALEGGGYGPASFLVQDESFSLTKLELADVDGNGAIDVVTIGRRGPLLLYKNAGTGEFGEPTPIKIGDVAPNDITFADANEDGRQDILVCFSRNGSVHFVFNLGADGFSDPEVHGTGVAVTKARFLDLNGDRVKDLAAFSRFHTGIHIGISSETPLVPRFLRGDADNDGKVALNDAVTVLNYLFRGAGQLSCPDAGDSDDDGKVSLTDAVEMLSYLFRGGRSPADPGAEECGEDPSEDELGNCAERC